MIAVLVVGQHPPAEQQQIDAVCGAEHSLANAVAAPTGVTDFYTAVLPCNSVADMLAQVKQVFDKHGPIDILDVVDHGMPGSIICGVDTLFKHDGQTLVVGGPTADQLAPMLSKTALLRLLGCKTGLAAPGRYLVLAVGKHLGEHRAVFGTIDRIKYPDQFTPDRGFVLEREMLYSSYEALDTLAPDQATRNNNILAVDPYLVDG